MTEKPEVECLYCGEEMTTWPPKPLFCKSCLYDQLALIRRLEQTLLQVLEEKNNDRKTEQ